MKADRSKAERSLSSKGFYKDKSRDHIYYYHEFNGQRTGPWTKVSHSKKVRVLSGDLLSCMRKQLRLDTNMQTANLLNCPMDKDEFNSIMKSKGVFG